MQNRPLLFVCPCFLLFCILSAAEPPSAQKPQLMHAYQWDGKTDVTGWWISEKLDGIRGIWTGKELVSRAGNPIRVPAWFTNNFPPFGLDGELWISRGRFADISGIVHRKDAGDAWKQVSYYIFDVPHEQKAFEARLAMAEAWFNAHPSDVAKILKQIRCKGNDHLIRLLSEVEKKGGEGLMIRRPGSLYTNGRSTDILKVKTYHDAEAVVIEHIGGKGKYKGKMGSIRVELPNGIQFRIGTGFTDRQRENPPPVGSIITFKYKEINPSGIPRDASFLRVRHKDY